MQVPWLSPLPNNSISVITKSADSRKVRNMTEEELKNHCEKTVVKLSMKEKLTGQEQRRKEEHQLVLDIIEERDEIRSEWGKFYR